MFRPYTRTVPVFSISGAADGRAGSVYSTHTRTETYIIQYILLRFISRTIAVALGL